jgi:uncharacterized protein
MSANSPDSLSPPLPLVASAFPESRGATPTLIQTHIGYVYLVGECAYKLKKQVRFDFLDFSTLAQRKWALERELELNRRLCPDLYRRLLPVVELPDGSRRIGAANESAKAVDWALEMERMPAERLFDRLLKEDAVRREDIDKIAAILTPFYGAQRGRIAPGGYGDVDSVRGNIEENLKEGAELDAALLPPEQLALIAARARRFLDRYGVLIRKRCADGFVVDGHGDLRAENICLPLGKPPLLFDCIEFNDRFRIGDSALDIAFLAMELSACGRDDLAAHFVAAYKKSSDPALPDRLLEFYLGYRAFVKGKVDAWIARDTHIDAAQRDRSTGRARSYFDLSLAYALRSEPILLVFCGVSGSGKSSLARSIAARLRATHFATDLLRDELIPRGTPNAERYAPAASARVYDEVFARAEKQLREGPSHVVLADGTFTSRELRAKALARAKAAGARCLLFWADCAPDAIQRHMEAREASNERHGSEGTAAVAAAQRQRFECPENDPFDAVLRIDTSASLDDACDAAWLKMCVALKS